MLRRVGTPVTALLTAGVLATLATTAPAQARADHYVANRSKASAHSPVVTVTAPKSAIEGDRIRMTVKVGATRRAQKVQLFKWTKSLYSATYSWERVTSHKVHGPKNTFTVVTTNENSERYRASVTYGNNPKPVTSKPVNVTIWRWIPLSNFDPYYSTSGVSTNEYTEFQMNGTEYPGWMTYGNYPTWESRHTPGRHCQTFRGVVGLNDASDDGSTGQVTLLSDETTTVYTSPVLTPGASHTMQVNLAKPYRFTIQAANTSTPDLSAYPAIGNPEFLCTNL